MSEPLPTRELKTPTDRKREQEQNAPKPNDRKPK